MSHLHYRVMGLVMFCALARAQVTVELGGDVPTVGPGTKVPTITVCNETPAPQQVQGWKFRTKDFQNYGTYYPVGQLTHAPGAGSIDYTQYPIAPTEQQIWTSATPSITAPMWTM